MLHMACGNNGKAKIKNKRIKERSEIVFYPVKIYQNLLMKKVF